MYQPVTIKDAANAPAALKLAKEAARQAKAAVASQDGTSVKKPVVKKPVAKK